MREALTGFKDTFTLTFDVLGSHLPLKQYSVIETLTTLPEDGFSVTIIVNILEMPEW